MATARVERRLAAILAADVVGYSPAHGAGRGRHARRASRPHRRELDRPARSPSTAAASSSSWATARWSSSPPWSTRSPARSRSSGAWPSGEAGRARGRAHPLPDRHQPRRRGRRGRRRPLRRRGERRRPARGSSPEPGGICLSEDAYRQVKGKIKVDFEDLGRRELREHLRACTHLSSHTCASQIIATTPREHNRNPVGCPSVHEHAPTMSRTISLMV